MSPPDFRRAEGVTSPNGPLHPTAWSNVLVVPRRHRITLDLPADLVAQATSAAQASGDVLSVVVHSAIVTAAKAAEAGRVELLPERLPRRSPGVSAGPTSPLAYTASREQAARVVAALEAAGSSVRVVAIRALESYVAAGGSWLDAPMPGEPGRAWRVSGAA